MANLTSRAYLPFVTDAPAFHATAYSPEEARARREAAVARAMSETGIDEGLIDQLVERFYDKVRADEIGRASCRERVCESV